MNPPTCPLPGHPSRVPAPWAVSETHHHQSTGEGLQATLQAEWILPIEVGDSTWDAGGEGFGIVQDYYQMIRGGTKGRESERSSWFVEVQEWENIEIKLARYLLSGCWSIHLSGHALYLITSVCFAYSFNSISDYFPE